MSATNRNIKKYYSRIEDYDWTKAADKFIGPETFFHRFREKEIVRLLKKYGKRGFLDLGCGTGLILRHLPSGSVGVDINPRNLEKTKKYAPRAKLVLHDIEERLPFDNEEFNTVICCETLEHLLFPEKVLDEISRILSKDGVLVGSVPGKSILWKLRKISFSSKYFAEEPYHKHRNKKEVEDLLSPCFRLISFYSKPFRMNWYFVAKRINN
ncbi:MAG: class I SAM-dependent methyltransferase [Patescibacteria group bacterium]|jgi:SAM-dependent methyltransferase